MCAYVTLDTRLFQPFSPYRYDDVESGITPKLPCDELPGLALFGRLHGNFRIATVAWTVRACELRW